MIQTALCLTNENPGAKTAAEFFQAQNIQCYFPASSGKNAVSECLRQIQAQAGKLDYLLLGTKPFIAPDGPVGTPRDYEALLALLDGEITHIQNAIDHSLPLLRESQTKRICLVTDPSSSISTCRDDRDFGRHMMLSGLNMLGKIYFNKLRPEGFTFRWYCDDTSHGGMSAGEYFLTGLCYDPKEPYQHSDENRLVMRNRYLQEIPW